MKKKTPSTGKTNSQKQQQKVAPKPGTLDYNKQLQNKLINSIKDRVKTGINNGFIFFDRKVPTNLKLPRTIKLFEIPEKVDRPTSKTIAKLERIRDTLYDNAIWNDSDYSPELPEYNTRTTPYPEGDERRTGTFTGQEGLKIRRSRAGKKGAETRKRNKTETPDWEPPNNPQPPPVRPPWEVTFTRIRGYLERLESIRGNGTPSVQAERERHGHALLQFFDNIVAVKEADGTEHIYSQYLDSQAGRIATIVDAMMRDSTGEEFETNVQSLCTILKGEPISLKEADDLRDYFDGQFDFFG